MEDKKLDQVRKLLAKAEHPNTPSAEAEALSAKAEALMAKYAIDHALLEAAAGDKRETPEVRKIEVQAPYVVPKASLLNAIARAFDVMVVLTRKGSASESGQCSVVGFPSDLDSVELLYTSLLLQATSAMLRGDHGGSGARSYRHAFLLAFSVRVGARLQETRRKAEAQATVERGTGTELVLASRGAEVDRVYAEAHPKVRSISTSSSSMTGRRAGDAAGRSANLSTGRGAVRGSSRALTS